MCFQELDSPCCLFGTMMQRVVVYLIVNFALLRDCLLVRTNGSELLTFEKQSLGSNGNSNFGTTP